MRVPRRYAIIGDSNVAPMKLWPWGLNLGVSGDTSKMMAERFRPGLLRGCRRLVVWATPNDAHFDKPYGIQFIRDIAICAARYGIPAILTTPPPMDDGHPVGVMEARLSGLAIQILALGASEGFPVAALFEALSMPDGSPNPALYLPDRQHLNRDGQRLALKVISALI